MKEFQDLIGKKFGLLTVVDISDMRDKYDNIHWACLCECGNECTIRGSSLKNGHTKSCGCLKKKEDDAGKVFGELTVLGRVEKIGATSPYLKCLCTCGNLIEERRDLLVRGKKTFCGDKSKHKQNASRYIEEKGHVYGKLTVLQKHPKKGVSEDILWDCKCECGNQIVVRGPLLRNKSIDSCGCDREMPYKDETGTKYGKWVVDTISEKKGKNGETYWNCTCECGTKKQVLAVSLRNGYSKSCGCDKNTRGNKALRNEVGNKYGSLKVIERDTEKGMGKVYWLCRCDCGQSTSVRADKLRSGHVKSCGCIKSGEDLSGKIFGKLKVIKFDKLVSKESYWQCVCECGKETSKRGSDLKNGHIKACSKGCLASDNFLETGINSIISQYTGMAKRNNREYLLSRDDIKNIIFSDCYYCGKPPSNELKTARTKKLKFKYSGIDRINSTLGYTLDNTRPCCSVCNIAKSDMSEDEFYRLIDAIHKKKNDNLKKMT